MSITDEFTKDLDRPFETNIELNTGLTRFMKGRIEINIIYPDNTIKTYYKKLLNPYFMTIKKDSYLIVPDAFIYRKRTCGYWYFKNPKQIRFKYATSDLTALDMRSASEIASLTDIEKSQLLKVAIDSSSLHISLTTNIFKSMYARGGLTTKQIIIILIVVVVIILIILQMTGKVDFIGGLNNAVSGIK